MATHVEDQDQQALLPNEQIHDPASNGLTPNNADRVENLAAREPTADSDAVAVATEQARSSQQQEGGTTTTTTTTTTPGVRMSDSEPGFNLLFPHLEWARPGASSLQDASPSASAGSNPIPVRRQRIPYVQPVDSVPGVPTDDLGFSSAFGMEDMPGILMYAPERPLLSPAAGSMDAIPDRMVLCVEEDAFERAWIAPQWYWRSAF